jgi:hypothetical protein
MEWSHDIDIIQQQNIPKGLNFHTGNFPTTDCYLMKLLNVPKANYSQEKCYVDNYFISNQSQ